jgi:hypothetical protein
MESPHERICILPVEAAVEQLQGENQTLRRQLFEAEKDTKRPKLEEPCGSTVSEANVEVAEATAAPPPATTAIAAAVVLPNGLGREHIERYSRQLHLADG